MAAFVDTNIVFYAFAESSAGQTDKVQIARNLMELLSRRRELVLSAQVLSEFSSAALRKSELGLRKITERVQQLRTEIVVSIDAPLVQLALARVAASQISYWDALIVEAALHSGATILYTEDMHHGARYGSLQLRNPFLEASAV